MNEPPCDSQLDPGVFSPEARNFLRLPLQTLARNCIRIINICIQNVFGGEGGRRNIRTQLCLFCVQYYFVMKRTRRAKPLRKSIVGKRRRERDRPRPVKAAPLETTPNRLRQNLRQVLFEEIVSGTLKPGAVNESQLARRLKVSRTPLREALLQLERDGFARSDLRRGFTIEGLSARDIREIYPMLWTLEGLALRSSTVVAHLLVPDLIRINQQLSRALQPERAISLDAQWHEMLTSQSRNRRLQSTIASLRAAVRRYELFYMSDNRLIALSAAQHDKIIAALKHRDIESAISLLEPNWSFGMQVLLKMMGEES